MKKKICFVIQDGASIKNYLYSDIIPLLLKNNTKLSLLYSVSDDAINEAEKLHNFTFEKFKIPYFKESYISLFLKEITIYAKLNRNRRLTNNKTILTNWNPKKNTLINYLFYKCVEIIGLLVSYNYSILRKTEFFFHKLLSKNSNFENILQEIKPDTIFNTNQRYVSSAVIVELAKRNNIKTVGCIFSWDNLPKGNKIVKTDYYFVWSSFMKQELCKFYPEINADKIIITGTPQFEAYNKTSLYKSRDNFLSNHDLNPKKRIICFSGDDQKTSPFDAIYLENIALEILKIEPANRPQILFRPCPVDLSDRYDEVVAKYPNLIKRVNPIWNLPKTSKNNWNKVYPHYLDIQMLVNIVLHCDTVVNIGSTMAHDFAVLNKPAIYLHYNTSNSKKWTTEMIYNYEHFKSMPSKSSVFWINKKENITKIISKAISQKSNNVVSGDNWLNIIAENRNKSSMFISNELNRI